MTKILISLMMALILSGCGKILSGRDFTLFKGVDLRFSVFSDVSSSNLSSYEFAGKCVPDYGDVTVDIGEPSVMQITTPCLNSRFSGSVDLSSAGLPQGYSYLAARQLGLEAIERVRVFVDTIAPAAPIILSPTNGQATHVTNILVSGTCEASATVRLSGDLSPSLAETICTSSGTFSTNVNLTSATGSKNITALQLDGTGNVSPSTTIAVILNLPLPLAPTVNTPVSNQLLNNAVVTISGGCETGATVNISGQVSSAPVTSVCMSGMYSQSVTLSGGQGANAFSVSQTNASGTSPSVSRSVRLDSVAPSAPVISNPINNSYVNNVSVTVSGTCEPLANVNISGTFVAPGSFSTSCTAGGTFSRSVTLTSAQGAKTINANQTDEAGNISTSSTVTVHYDNIAPAAPTIVSPSNGSTLNTASVTVTGVCEIGAIVTLSGGISPSPSSVTCMDVAGSGQYSLNVNFTTGFGSKTIAAAQRDLSNNTSGSVSVVVMYTDLAVSYPAMATTTKHYQITPIEPLSIVGMPTSFVISPALPTGLSLNTMTGAITGRPTRSDEMGTDYTISVNNGSATIQVGINIKVLIPDYTWMGTAGDGLWSTASNWKANAVPPTSAHTFFDEECLVSGYCNASIDVSTTVNRVYMKPVYTGVITQNPGITFQVGSRSSLPTMTETWAKWEMEAGTFNGGNANITVDRLNIIGGTFNSTSAELRLGSVYRHVGCASGTPDWDWKGLQDCGFSLGLGGIFNHRNGTFRVNSEVATPHRPEVFVMYLDTPLNLHNLIVEIGSSGQSDIDGRYSLAGAHIHGTSKTINVANGLDWRDGYFNFGTINYQGLVLNLRCDTQLNSNRCSDLPKSIGQVGYPENINHVGEVALANIRLNRNDGMAQTVEFDDGAGLSMLELDNPNGLNLIENGPNGYLRLGALKVNRGVFTAPKHLSFGDGSDSRWSGPLNAPQLLVSADGVFNHNMGRITVDYVTTYDDTRTALTIRTVNPLELYNFTINLRANFPDPNVADDLYTVSLSEGQNLVINNDLIVKNGSFSGPSSTLNSHVHVKGDVRFECLDPVTGDCYGPLRYLSLYLEGLSDTTLTFEPGGGGQMLFASRFILNKDTPSTRVTLVGNGGGAADGFRSPVISLTQGVFDLQNYLFNHNYNFVNNAIVSCDIGNGYMSVAGAITGTPQAGNELSCYGP